MASKHCDICEIKQSFFYRKPICKLCQETKYNHYLIGDNILELSELDNDELKKLAHFGSNDCLHLYSLLFNRYLKNERLSKEQIISLRKISNTLSLDDKTRKYEMKNEFEDFENKEKKELENIRDLIKKNKSLPLINEYYFDRLNFQLQKNEQYFISGLAKFHEQQVLSSRQSFGERIVKRGPKLKSEGSFIITWNRFYYIPKDQGDFLTIDLSKIIKYETFDNFLLIRKIGRMKPYLFQMNSHIAAVCRIGLDFLFERKK